LLGKIKKAVLKRYSSHVAVHGFKVSAVTCKFLEFIIGCSCICRHGNVLFIE